MKDRIKLSLEQSKEIREALLIAGIETRALADRFGITHSSMNNYLSGKHSMPSWMYERLQKIINSYKKYQ